MRGRVKGCGGIKAYTRGGCKSVAGRFGEPVTKLLFPALLPDTARGLDMIARLEGGSALA